MYEERFGIVHEITSVLKFVKIISMFEGIKKRAACGGEGPKRLGVLFLLYRRSIMRFFI